MLIAIYPEIIGSESFEQIESEVSIMETHIKVILVSLIILGLIAFAVNQWILSKL